MGFFDRFRTRPAAPGPAPITHVKRDADLAAAEEARQAGNTELQAGRLERALDSYDRFAQLRPDHAPAQLNRGFVLSSLGRHAEAEQALRQARQLDPSNAESAYFLGQALEAQSRWADALAQYRDALRIDERFVHAGLALATAHEQLGQPEEALRALQQLVHVVPTSSDAWQGIARLALANRQFDEALQAASQWVALDAQAAPGHGMRADALRGLGRFDEALQSAEAARRLAPDDRRICLAHGGALLATQRFAEAAEALRRATTLERENAAAHAELGAALCALERSDEALAALDEALRIDPALADAAHNRALTLMNQLQYGPAEIFLREQAARRPEDARLQFDLAICLLAQGRWAEGWRQYEWRLSAAARASEATSRPARWRPGQAISGQTVLIHAEQGLGDTIHFVRYVPELVARGARVALLAQPRLQALLGELGPQCRWVAQAGEAPEASLQAPLLSLPDLLGLPEPLTMSAPYARANIERSAHWRSRLTADGFTDHRAPLRIGLAWAGNAKHPDDRRRSMTLETLRQAFADLPGVQWVSLQLETPERDRSAALAWPGLLAVGAEQQDMADTAALIGELDLTISVDTSIAHLVGALGRPLWLLLSHNPDWRWGLEGDRSAWYPSATLWRQPSPGHWPGVLQPMRERLAAMVSSHESTAR